jgi:hypothetical protein
LKTPTGTRSLERFNHCLLLQSQKSRKAIGITRMVMRRVLLCRLRKLFGAILPVCAIHATTIGTGLGSPQHHTIQATPLPMFLRCHRRLLLVVLVSFTVANTFQVAFRTPPSMEGIRPTRLDSMSTWQLRIWRQLLHSHVACTRRLLPWHLAVM